MDSVTGLSIDAHGLYLLSGGELFPLPQSKRQKGAIIVFSSPSSTGHDGSLRFWSMDSKMCIQTIEGAHRKHFDESIHNIASHSSEPFFASAGADGIAKVYT